MPQDLGLIPIKDPRLEELQRKQLGLIPVSGMPQMPEPSWTQSIIANAINPGLPLVAGVAGTIGGGPVVGGGLGAAVGGLASWARQQYEMSQTDEYGRLLRTEHRPMVDVLEAAGNALPGLTKAPASMALGQLAKYGVKTGLESAGTAAIAAPAYSKAETGEWDFSGRNIGQSALAGGAMGAILGPSIHVGANRLGGPSVTTDTNVPPPNVPPPSPNVPPPPTTGGFSLDPLITITHPNAAQNDFYLRQHKYVKIGVNEQGYPQLARPDVAPMYVNTGLGKETRFGIIPGEEIPVPNSRVNETTIADLRAGGYEVDRRDNTTTYFKRFIADESGTFDPQQMWQNLKGLLGRDPTPEEVDRSMARQVRPGEVTGRVAPFDRDQAARDQLNSLVVEEPSTATEDLQARVRLDQIGKSREELTRLLGREPVQEELDSYEGNIQARGTDEDPLVSKMTASEYPRQPDLMDNVADQTRKSTRELELMRADDLEAQGRKEEADVIRKRVNNYLNEREPRDILLHINDKYKDRPDITQRAAEIYVEEDLAKISDNYNRQHNELEEFLRTVERHDEPFNRKYLELAELRHIARAKYERAALRQTHPEFLPSPDKPQFMRVRQGGYGAEKPGPIIVNPKTGRPNLAMGGADPQVIRQLGTSLYTKDRPSVLIQELFQNTIDEMKIAGIQEPVRVVFINNSQNPVTGTDQKSIVFQDFGRGMNENQLYNEFSDVGKSGKRHIQGAAGGFGFAKAAPFLGGEHMRVESITMEGGEKVRYTFEGTPEQFVNQEVGVPLNREVLDDPYDMNYDKPTGMRVEVFFGRDKYFNSAKELLEMVSENSTGVKNIESYDNYGSLEDSLDSRSTTSKFIREGEAGLSSYDRTNSFRRFESLVPPPQVATVRTPSNDTDVRYELDNNERSSTTIIYLNNGTFYHTERMGIGLSPMPHIPKRIILDIKSKVPEGHTDYPFPANREGINQNVRNELKGWVNRNVVDPARTRYRGEIQQVYNSLQPVGTNRHVVLDSGAKYTPEELARVQQSPTLRRVGEIMEYMLDDLASYFQPSERKGVTGKFGFRIADEGQGGINIHDPSTSGANTKYAILINPFDGFRTTFASGPAQTLTPQQAARRFVHLIKHEFTHNLVRDEGAGFTWAFSQVDTRFPNTEDYVAQVFQTIAGPSGNYAGEVQGLLQEYIVARGRPESQVDILSRQTESPFLARAGQAGISGGNQPDGTGTPTKKREHWLSQLWNLPRQLMATADLSAPLRQGLPMIHTKEWWTSWGEMAKSWKSKEAYDQIMAELKSRPEFQRPIDPVTLKFGKSYAEKIGLSLTDIVGDLTKREENTVGELIAKWYPLADRSNRAYTAYLNTLRADTLKALLRDAEKMGLDPLNDMNLGRAIASYINTATGRGSLGALEPNAKLLSNLFFAPRLMASRIQMLNPATYLMGPSFVRKQHLKSLLATAGAWGTFATIGAIGGADVSLDPESTDFGKIRIGNTRLDPAGGFQQYIVAATRLLTGKTKTSGRRLETGGDFPAPTRYDIATNFMLNKANPAMDFALDILRASKQRPMYVNDRIAQMFVPMIATDIWELAHENPGLIPIIVPAVGIGMGAQSYERGKEKPKLIPQRGGIIPAGRFEGGSAF